MASHIIHKPTSSRLNLPSAPAPTGPPVTTNAPFPIGQSPRCSKVIWGFAGLLGIGKFTFPLVQMTGDDTVQGKGGGGDQLLDRTVHPHSTCLIFVNR